MTDAIDYFLGHIHYGDPIMGGIVAGIIAVAAVLWMIRAVTKP